MSADGSTTKRTLAQASTSPTTTTWRTTTSQQQTIYTNTAKTYGSSLLHWILTPLLTAWQPTSISARHKPQQKPTGNRQTSPHSLQQSWMRMDQPDVIVGAVRRPGICLSKPSDILYELCGRWHQVQQVPATLVYSRQADLPKQHKVQNGHLKACHTRPIAVYSIFYRSWASAWTRTPQFQSFAERLPKEISGVQA